MINGKLEASVSKEREIINKAIKENAVYVGENLRVKFDVDTPRSKVTGSTRGNYWGYQLDTLEIEKAWSESTGKGVKIAVVDSGVDMNEVSLRERVLPGWSPDGSDGRADSNGHGTAVASILAGRLSDGNGVVGIAPDSLVVPIAVVGNSGFVSSDIVVRGIVWAVDSGVDIINISMSGVEDYPPLQAAVEYALGKDVMVVASGGNFYQNGNPTTFPASYKGVIAVGAVDRDNLVATYSNQGGYISLVAPGNNILAPFVGNGVSSWEGTSVAAPMISGLFAIMLAKYPFLNVKEIFQAVSYTAKDLATPGVDISTGYGLPSISEAIKYINSNYYKVELKSNRVAYGQEALSLNVSRASNEAFAGALKVNLTEYGVIDKVVSRSAISDINGEFSIRIDDNTKSVEIPSYSKDLPSLILPLTRYLNPKISIKNASYSKSITIKKLCIGCKLRVVSNKNTVVKSVVLKDNKYTVMIPKNKKYLWVKYTVTPKSGSNGEEYSSKPIKL
jgi:subtilisin family serine protease